MYGIDSSIIAMTTRVPSSFYDLSNAGGTSGWAVTTSLVRRSDATLTGSGNLAGSDPNCWRLRSMVA